MNKNLYSRYFKVLCVCVFGWVTLVEHICVRPMFVRTSVKIDRLWVFVYITVTLYTRYNIVVIAFYCPLTIPNMNVIYLFYPVG